MQLLDEIYINKVCNNIFLESKLDRYMEMFNRPPFDRDKAGIQMWIQKAIDVLKKDDRISYFLNWYRLWYLWNTLRHYSATDQVRSAEAFADSNNQKRLQQLGILDYAEAYMRESAALAKRSRKNLIEILDEFSYFRPASYLEKMQDILDVPVPEIQNKVWDFSVLPTPLLNDFLTISRQFADAFKSSISAASTDKPIITFPDGYAWFDIHANMMVGGKEGKEAKLAQHCGNQYDRHEYNARLPKDMFLHEKDQVYILREPAHQGKIQRWKPVVTAVINGGTLIEMKGKQNDKPLDKYHQYIIPFVKSDLVKKMDASFSHQPEASFSLRDLPEATMQEILKLKGDDFEVFAISAEEKHRQRMREITASLNDVVTRWNGRSLHHSSIWFEDNEEDEDYPFTLGGTISFKVDAFKFTSDMNEISYRQKDSIRQEIQNYVSSFTFDGIYMDNEHIRLDIQTRPADMDSVNDDLGGLGENLKDFEREYYDQVFEHLKEVLEDEGYLKAKPYKALLADLDDKYEYINVPSPNEDTVDIAFTMYSNKPLTQKQKDDVSLYLNDHPTFDEYISQEAGLASSDKHPEFKYESVIKHGHIFDEVHLRQYDEANRIMIKIRFLITNIKEWDEAQLAVFTKAMDYIENNYKKLTMYLADIVSGVTGTLMQVKQWRQAGEGSAEMSEKPVPIAPEGFQDWYLKQLQKGLNK